MKGDPCAQWDEDLYPHWETPKDRAREEAVRELLALEILKCPVVKLPDRLKVDWEIYNRQAIVVAYAEFKWRDIQHDTFDDVILSADKANGGYIRTHRGKLPFWFFGWFKDGIWRYQFTWQEQTQEGFPRREGDPRPPEKVVLMPASEFIHISDPPGHIEI